MKLSIITTCYNREATIRDAIESLLLQEYSDVEYIVVDGASKDGSLSIIEEYKGRITTIISEPDKGMYEAINKGIRAASGDVVGLLHSDDTFYCPQTLTRVAKQMAEQGADFLYGDGLFVDYDNPSKVVRNWVSGRYQKSRMRRGWLPLHTTVFIRKECFDRLGLYDESYRIAADSDLLVRYLYKEDLRVTYLDHYIVKMRMGGLSTDPKRMKQKFDEDRRLYKTHGFSPLWTIACKMLSKVPQFVMAKFK